MPFRRSRRTRKSRSRKTRRFRRSRRSVGLTRYIRNNIHSYKRRYYVGGLVTSTLGEATLGMSFRLDSLPNYAEFTALYDQYKITGVLLNVTWRSTTLSAIESANTSQTGVPWMLHWVDRDDDSTPTYAAAQEVSRVRRYTFDTGKRNCRIFFRPNTLSATYVSAVSTGYSSDFNRWVDVGNTDVKFYGYKLAIHAPWAGTGSAPAYYFDVEAVLYLKFKDPR